MFIVLGEVIRYEERWYIIIFLGFDVDSGGWYVFDRDGCKILF